MWIEFRFVDSLFLILLVCLIATRRIWEKKITRGAICSRQTHNCDAFDFIEKLDFARSIARSRTVLTFSHWLDTWRMCTQCKTIDISMLLEIVCAFFVCAHWWIACFCTGPSKAHRNMDAVDVIKRIKNTPRTLNTSHCFATISGNFHSNSNEKLFCFRGIHVTGDGEPK